MQSVATRQCLDVSETVSNVPRCKHGVCSLVQCVGSLRLIIADDACCRYRRVIDRAVISGADTSRISILPICVAQETSSTLAVLIGAV